MHRTRFDLSRAVVLSASMMLAGCVLRSPVTRTFTFMPKPVLPARAHPVSWGFMDGSLDSIPSPTPGVSLLAWWIPSSRIPARCGGVVLLHGKGKNRTEMAPLARAWSASGFDVLVPDYRGYGGSSGEPTDSGMIEDAESAYAHLRRRMDAADVPVVVVGHSMGTALAAHLARAHPDATPVYLSPFSRIATLTRARFGWVGAQMFDTTFFAFNPLDDARQSTRRAVVAIAGRDLLIPRVVADEFVAGLSPAPLVLTDARATHNSILSSPIIARPMIDTVRSALGCR
jgi:uncharacterized protein